MAGRRGASKAGDACRARTPKSDLLQIHLRGAALIRRAGGFAGSPPPLLPPKGNTLTGKRKHFFYGKNVESLPYPRDK
jgi:hypothetical protein